MKYVEKLLKGGGGTPPGDPPEEPEPIGDPGGTKDPSEGG